VARQFRVPGEGSKARFEPATQERKKSESQSPGGARSRNAGALGTGLPPDYQCQTAQTRFRAPKIAGRWLVTADVPGRGRYYGELQVEPGAAEDEFTTRVTLTSIKDGSTISRTGHSLVYAGYAWRGRSQGTVAANAAPDDLGSTMREVMSISPDQSTAEGRWFWGEYQEFGFDVKMQRPSADPTLIGADRSLLKTGSQGTRVRLIAESLPAQIEPADLDFGTSVTVRRIVSHTPTEIVAEVDVAADAVPGSARPQERFWAPAPGQPMRRTRMPMPTSKPMRSISSACRLTLRGLRLRLMPRPMRPLRLPRPMT